MQQLADWLSGILGGGRGAGSIQLHDSDQHGEIDPPVDYMDRTDSLAFLLRHAVDLISMVLNGTNAQVRLCPGKGHEKAFPSLQNFCPLTGHLWFL